MNTPEQKLRLKKQSIELWETQSKVLYGEKRKEIWKKPEHWIKKFNLWYGVVDYGENPYCELWNEELRERDRGSYGGLCFLCMQPQNGKKHHVHHVLWNKKTCCDKSKRYLIPLCVSCHSKVRGNKTKSRKEWMDEIVIMIEGYYEGKSFLTKEEWDCIKDAPHIPLETRYDARYICLS